MKEEKFIEILRNYCQAPSKIFFYAASSCGTRYVNFAFRINEKNYKKNEVDKLMGLSIDDSILKQNEYLDRLQDLFESYEKNYLNEENKEISELKIIYDNKTNGISTQIENRTQKEDKYTLPTKIFDKWFKEQR